jgi:sugar phosphate isomerase/epimerase
LYLVHAKDVAPIPGYAEDDPRRLGCVPAGQGIIDFPGFVSALNAASYRGMVLIEISGVHPKYSCISETEMLRESLAYLKKLLLKNENDETYAR